MREVHNDSWPLSRLSDDAVSSKLSTAAPSIALWKRPLSKISGVLCLRASGEAMRGPAAEGEVAIASMDLLEKDSLDVKMLGRGGFEVIGEESSAPAAEMVR